MLCAATAATAAATGFAAAAAFCGPAAAERAPPAADPAAFGTAADPSIEARLAGSNGRNGSMPSPAGVAVRPG